MKSIKRNTLSFRMNLLNLLLDTGDSVTNFDSKNIETIKIDKLNDFRRNKVVNEFFPKVKNTVLNDKMDPTDFFKLTEDMNQKTIKNEKKLAKIFSPKKPVITYILITLNVMIYLFLSLYDTNGYITYLFANNSSMVKSGEIYRLLTGGFLHLDIFHLMFNMYALYIVGKQVENMLGRWKYLIIYLFSLLAGSLLSAVLSDAQSIGASGAIFGLMGSLLYFGYYYRVYLGQIVKTQILPIIILNLAIGFLPGSNIDNFAHIGGLFGGFTSTMALGIKYKSNRFEKINGIIVSILYVILMLIIAFKFVE
jgi:rhomboid protease GluP